MPILTSSVYRYMIMCSASILEQFVLCYSGEICPLMCPTARHQRSPTFPNSMLHRGWGAPHKPAGREY